ncbi:MAG: CoA transferase [Dehalococcoidia bacterium]|jgi:crotonobetainyl-CoA:carnitine CoA-transferase CaiB-like acyl-CoA transferase|nr:CoA transferase [Dehalococcoidia bacterium]
MSGLLAGIRIVDFTHTLAGLFGAMLLADQGAEVIKVEPRQFGGKGVGARFHTRWSQGSADLRFIHLNRNKKGLGLNLKSPEGRQVFHDLAARSDVVLDNFRPDVMTRLGIDYENLCPLNPRIICCSVTAFGTMGPYANRPAADVVMQGHAGTLSMAGEAGQPINSSVPLADLSAGMLLSQGVTSALFYRERTGKGQRMEVSLLGATLCMLYYEGTHFLNSGTPPVPVGTKYRGVPLVGIFHTADGFITLMAITEDNWRDLCRVLERPDLLEDPRFTDQQKRVENLETLNQVVEEIFYTRPAAYWIKCLAEDVPCGPVNTLDQTFADSHVMGMGMVGKTIYDGQEYRIIGNPIRNSAFPEPTYAPPPSLGEHTEEVLTNILGYSAEQMSRLREAEAI